MHQLSTQYAIAHQMKDKEYKPDTTATPGHEPWLNEDEESELLRMESADKLWQPPDDFPDDLRHELPGEDLVVDLHGFFFGPNPSAEWTLEKARAMINVGRKKTYRLWKEEKLPPS